MTILLIALVAVQIALDCIIVYTLFKRKDKVTIETKTDIDTFGSMMSYSNRKGLEYIRAQKRRGVE